MQGGRLVLADGISYLLKNYNDYLIDIALTGSSVGTLAMNVVLFTQ
jgi:leucyl aminopeptidase